LELITPLLLELVVQLVLAITQFFPQLHQLVVVVVELVVAIPRLG
jgi:hypothetical protein